MKQVTFFLVPLFLLLGCEETCDNIDISDIDVKFELHRLDQEFQNIKSLEDAKNYIRSSKSFHDYSLNNIYPNDSVFALDVYRKSQVKELQSFVKNVHDIYGDFEQTTLKEFEKVVRRVNFYYPEFKAPPVITTITGYGQNRDLIFSDESFIIGLDYLVGAETDYKITASGLVPDYVGRYCVKANAPKKFAMELSRKFNKFDKKDESLLAYMIYHGKELYFVEQVFPCQHDSLYIEYTKEEIEETKQFAKQRVWKHFIANSLFHSTDPEHVSKYISPRPKTFEVADDCPGRIGQWLGWQIVRSYMESHPDLTLKDLMTEKDAGKIFKQSGYRPPQ